MTTPSRSELSPPRWTRNWLLAAGIYNLAWGTFVIVSPLSLFRWVGLDPLPLYPEFWQCIGMIVGVYGIGYLVAASDAYRHWPIVLVGLLGKVFGPIGFVTAILQDRLPLALGWTILTNDVIWWIPFVAMLSGALRTGLVRSASRNDVGDPLSDLLSQKGKSLKELSKGQNVLVVFLRHTGCTFCREALADLDGQKHQIVAAGAVPVIVHMASEDSAAAVCDRFGSADLHRFSDPDQRLYRLFSLPQGGFRQLLGWSTLRRGAQAFFGGYGMGKPEGNVLRMPGVFLIRDGAVLNEFRHRDSGCRPDYVEVASPGQKMQPVPAAASRSDSFAENAT